MQTSILNGSDDHSYLPSGSVTYTWWPQTWKRGSQTSLVHWLRHRVFRSADFPLPLFPSHRAVSSNSNSNCSVSGTVPIGPPFPPPHSAYDGVTRPTAARGMAAPLLWPERRCAYARTLPATVLLSSVLLYCLLSVSLVSAEEVRWFERRILVRHVNSK